MQRRHHQWISVCGLLLAATCREAAGQESINTPAAVQTGEGRFVPRFQLRYTQFGADPDGESEGGHDATISTSLEYGVLSNLSLVLEAPVTFRERDGSEGADEDRNCGLGEVTLLAKYRIWQNDFGAVNTARLGLFGGAELPTGSGEFSSESFDPILGAAFTLIYGRHGFNQALSWKFTTGDVDDPVYSGEALADELRFDSAYLFRLAPRPTVRRSKGPGTRCSK